MAACASQGHITSRASTASLDLQTILSSYVAESLLSTRLSFSSTSSSLQSFQSFDDVPPFPAQRNPRLFVNDLGLAGQPSAAQHTPTTPIHSGDGSHSLLRPDTALTSLSKATNASWDPITAPWTSVSRLGDSAIGAQAKDVDSPGTLLLVPTIMVSNSTAALALSLESSSNLHSHQDLPLAIRRGKKPPPALSLDHPGKPSIPGTADSNSYPDIPSAFLGSSPTSPSFNRVNAVGGISKFDMGLSTMCNNLKALVPPPPFTPTEAEHRPPSYPPPSLEPETQWAMATTAQLPDANDEEWRFVQDLDVEWHETKGSSAEGCPVSSPPHVAAYTGIETPIKDASSKASPTSTLAGSRTDGNKSNVDVQQPSAQSSPSVKQSRRKTVIIQAPDGDIQIAPGDAERPAKSGKLCSPSGERSIDFLLDEFDEPVPFEIPSSVPLSAPASLEGSFCTPPSSRPTSTASSAGHPIRGILKEKKSVRFSAMPSLYEYASAMHGEPTDRPGTGALSVSKHHSDLDVLSALKHVPIPVAAPAPAPTRTPSKSSPLRRVQTRPHSYSPDTYGPERHASASDVSAPLHVTSASATMPMTPAPVRTPMTPPLTTMAKHPAVRALAHKPSPTRPPALQIHSPTMGAGAGGAVVGAPALQSPYPTMSSPLKTQGQRRTPLKTLETSTNVRHNAANMVERKLSAASSSPAKHASPPRVGRKDPPSHSGYKGHGKENVGQRASQASARSSLERELHRGEALTPTTRRRSGGVLPRREDVCGGALTPAGAGAGTVGSQSWKNSSSRMPVPLRSIFTKLRP
ncbi:hypothetical protein V8D89_013514 [Ganoderma adspersum]